MAATTVGIIYSLAQRRRRALYKFDSDTEPRPQPRAGEGYIEQAVADYAKRGPDAAVQDACGGQPPLTDRCAVVDPKSNLVVAHICADPAIDDLTKQPTHPLAGDALVLSDLTLVGDQYTNGKFMRSFAIVDSSGAVQNVQAADITAPPAPGVNQFVIAAGNLKSGDTVAMTRPADQPAAVA